MKRAIIASLLALLAASPGMPAALLLVQDGLSSGSARSSSAHFVLEQTTGFPFGGVSAHDNFIEAGGFYPIGTTVSGVGIGTSGGAAGALPPRMLTLNRPYPNPGLRPAIRFGLPRQDRVSLRVYNILGQEVAALADGVRPAGWHVVSWDGLDKNGRAAANGVYLLRLMAAGRSLTQKMTVVR